MNITIGLRKKFLSVNSLDWTHNWKLAMESWWVKWMNQAFIRSHCGDLKFKTPPFMQAGTLPTRSSLWKQAAFCLHFTWHFQGNAKSCHYKHKRIAQGAWETRDLRSLSKCLVCFDTFDTYWSNPPLKLILATRILKIPQVEVGDENAPSYKSFFPPQGLMNF